MNDDSQSSTRLCILLESYLPIVGGMESQAGSLAASLNDRGYELLILTRRTRPELPAEEVRDGIRIRRAPPRGESSRLRWGLTVTGAWVLFRERRAFDVILVPGFRALGITGVFMSKLLKKPCVLKAENNGELSGAFFEGGLKHFRMKKTNPVVRWGIQLRNRLLARADAFVSMSSDISTEYRDCGIRDERVHFIPQTVDVEKFRPASGSERTALRESLELPREHPLVVFTGRLVSWKGLPLLLRVWKDVQPRFPAARLILVGGGSSDMYNCEQELRTFAKENDLEESVVFTGDVSNVQDYLRAADVFVFPTLNEAFGVSLIEAMACGLPVISTDNGGIKDILTHEADGWVAQTGDADSLNRGLTEVLSTPALAARLGQAARETVLRRYTQQKVGDAYDTLFSSLLSRG